MCKKWLCIMAIVLGGCAPQAIIEGVKLAFSMESAKVWLQEVRFQVDPELNNNAPVTIHVVIAYDKGILEMISKLEARAYFEQETQIRADYRHELDIFSFEAAPGVRLENQVITPSKVSGVGGFIFVRYNTPGPHRAAIGPERILMIHLGQNDFKVTSVKS